MHGSPECIGIRRLTADNANDWRQSADFPSQRQGTKRNGIVRFRKIVALLAGTQVAEIRQLRLKHKELTGFAAAFECVEQKHSVVTLHQLLNKMHPTDAGFEHGHVSGKSSISLQRLQGSHAEPVVAFEEIADTRDKEAQCSASECRELRLVGYAEPDLEPAGTCGADRIAIQSWPSAQARAVANVVNTSWSMRANPGETSEHPSAHDRSMRRTDRRDGMHL